MMLLREQVISIRMKACPLESRAVKKAEHVSDEAWELMRRRAVGRKHMHSAVSMSKVAMIQWGFEAFRCVWMLRKCLGGIHDGPLAGLHSSREMTHVCLEGINACKSRLHALGRKVRRALKRDKVCRLDVLVKVAADAGATHDTRAFFPGV